jgi:NAD-dependent dihydropyrimidine dehydrogenase PreA subunit
MKQRYFKKVATISINETLCTGCSRCLDVCPHGVILVSDGLARLVQKDNCMECGACAKNCPFNAITVKSGVGCSVAIIKGWLNKSAPNCDCGGSDKTDCC